MKTPLSPSEIAESVTRDAPATLGIKEVREAIERAIFKDQRQFREVAGDRCYALYLRAFSSSGEAAFRDEFLGPNDDDMRAAIALAVLHRHGGGDTPSTNHYLEGRAPGLLTKQALLVEVRRLLGMSDGLVTNIVVDAKVVASMSSVAASIDRDKATDELLESAAG